MAVAAVEGKPAQPILKEVAVVQTAVEGFDALGEFLGGHLLWA